MTRATLRHLGLVSAIAALAIFVAAPARAAHEARNVIVFVGTGMGPTVTAAARAMRYKEDGTLTLDTLPYVARVRTASLDAQDPDGAAAVSALMTGVKVRNDVVAMSDATRSQGFAPGKDPIRGVPNAENRCPATNNGAPSPTLLELAIARNKATGIVTTARLTSGPAAATYAHVCHRDAAYEIARQAVPGGAGFNDRLGKGVDLMMGGDSSDWRPLDAARRPRGRPDNRELVGELLSQGYTFVSDLTSMNAAPVRAGSRVIGLFDFADGDGAPQSRMSFDLDRDPNREPSLAQMTVKAIDILSKNPAGYVLVVEGGRIDHALRAGNARRALVDTIALDDAVKAALERADPSRTLVLVTADHSSTLAYVGAGRRGSDVLGLNLDPVTGRPRLDEDGNAYASLMFGTGPNRPDKRPNLDTPTAVHRDAVQEAVFRLATGTSGGADVMVYATGIGSGAFRGTLDHAKIFGLVRQASDF